MLAAHIILTTYGFWLPNDPRGSWSDFVAAWELLRYGKATKVTTRRSVAHVPHNQQLRREAKLALKYPPVYLSGIQARAVARGFARATEEGSYEIHACSILDDHVHLVVAPHERQYEQIVSHLRSRATTQLRAEKLHPFASHEYRDGRVPSFWGEGLWKVYCFDREHANNAIAYVNRNPLREGKHAQSWSFVQALP
jgi:REP element-mobilizing transposase RayT